MADAIDAAALPLHPLDPLLKTMAQRVLAATPDERSLAEALAVAELAAADRVLVGDLIGRNAHGLPLQPAMMPSLDACAERMGKRLREAMAALDAARTPAPAAKAPHALGRRSLPSYWSAPTATREEAKTRLPEVISNALVEAAQRAAIQRQHLGALATIQAQHPAGSRERRQALRAHRQQMRAEHGSNWNHPGRRLLIPGVAGLGKTRELGAALHRFGISAGRVGFYTQRLELAEDFAQKVPGAMVARGRSAPNPESPTGERMCKRHVLAERVARAGLPVAETLCKDAQGRECPFRSGCAYLRAHSAMRSDEVNVVAASHEYLALAGALPTPDLVVIDEKCVNVLVGKVEFSADRLLPDVMERWHQAGLSGAINFRRIMGEVTIALRDRRGVLAGLRECGLGDAESLEPAIRYLRAVGENELGDVHPAMADAEIEDRLSGYAKAEVGALLRMLSALQAEIHLARDQAHGVRFVPDKLVKVDGREERQDRIIVHYRKRLAFSADTPVILLDASGDREIYARLFGTHLEVAEGLDCDRHAEVVQVRDVPMAKARLLGTDPYGKPLSSSSVAEAERLRAEVAAVANILAKRHGNLALFTNLPVERALAPLLAPEIRTGHFGGTRGSNEWEGCTVGLIVGREEQRPDEMEAIARALWSDDPKPLTLSGQYVRSTRTIRMRDGNAVPVEIWIHPDQRIQRVVELHRERETEQNIDRLRLIHNTNAKRIYVASNVPLNLTVDRVVTWHELVAEITGRADNGCEGKGRRLYINRPAEAFHRAGGVLPLSHRELPHLFPDLWASERAARLDVAGFGKCADSPIENPIGESAHLIPVLARYRLEGQRGRPSVALVADLVTAAEALTRLHGRPVVSLEPLPRSAEEVFPAHEPRRASPPPAPPELPSPAPPPPNPAPSPVPPGLPPRAIIGPALAVITFSVIEPERVITPGSVLPMPPPLAGGTRLAMPQAP